MKRSARAAYIACLDEALAECFLTDFCFYLYLSLCQSIVDITTTDATVIAIREIATDEDYLGIIVWVFPLVVSTT